MCLLVPRRARSGQIKRGRRGSVSIQLCSEKAVVLLYRQPSQERREITYDVVQSMVIQHIITIKKMVMVLRSEH